MFPFKFQDYPAGKGKHRDYRLHFIDVKVNIETTDYTLLTLSSKTVCYNNIRSTFELTVFIRTQKMGQIEFMQATLLNLKVYFQIYE